MTLLYITEGDREEKFIILSFLLFSIIVCFFNTLNSPFYLFNEWCDPHIYFSIGKGMFSGKVPYKDLFDHKGPLIYFIYGIAYLISNASLFGVYLIQSCFWFCSLLFAYRIARLFLDKPCSFVITLLHSTILYSKSGTGGSADEFIVPAITISFYYFLFYFRSKDYEISNLKRLMFIQGLTFAFTFFIKFSVCLFWVPLILVICYQLYKEKKYRLIFHSVLYFAGGFMIFGLPFLIYFLVNGALTDFIFAYFTFNSIYADTNMSVDAVLNIAVRFVKFTISFYIAFPLVLLGLGTLLFAKDYVREKSYKVGIFCSFVLLYLPIVDSRDHHLYAYIVLYFFAIIGLVFLFDILGRYFGKQKVNNYFIYILAFVSILVLDVYNQGLFGKNGSSFFCNENCSYGQKEFAEIINQESNPTLLDLGLDKGIYTEANIVPSYKYFFHPAIVSEIFPEIRNSQIDLVKNADPGFVVTSNIDFPYLEENYRLISTYNEMQYPHSQVYLFKRKNYR